MCGVTSQPPPIDTLAQFAAAEAAHLLAGVAFAAWQHADLFADETAGFGDVREDQVHRHFLAVVLHVVVHHHDAPAGARDPGQFGDHDGHLDEIVPHQPDDVRVAQLGTPTLQVRQHFLQGVLAGDGALGLRQHRGAGVFAIQPVHLRAVLHRGAEQGLPQGAEGGLVVAEPSEFQRVGPGVVVAVRVRRRRHRDAHRGVRQPRQFREGGAVDDAGRASAILTTKSCRISRHLAKPGRQRVRKRRNGALVHPAPQGSAAALIPPQILAVLACVAHLLKHAHAGEIQQRAELFVPHPRQVGARFGDGVLRFRRKGHLGNAHMGKTVFRRCFPASHRPQQASAGAAQRGRVHTVAHQGDRLGRPGAHGHDLDARGGAPQAAGHQHRRAEAGEGIQHRALPKAQGILGQIGREPLLVLEPAQARLSLVCLIGDEAAAQVLADDQAALEPLPQIGARRSVSARFAHLPTGNSWSVGFSRPVY